MREDPRVDVVLLIVGIFTFAFSFGKAFRRGSDDAGWELHWRSADAAQRARIVVAANSRKARGEMTAPEDLALVAGYTRRKARRRAYLEMPGSVVLVAGSLFVLGGVLGSGLLGLYASLFLVAVGTWEYLSEKQMDGRLRAVVEAQSTAGR